MLDELHDEYFEFPVVLSCTGVDHDLDSDGSDEEEAVVSAGDLAAAATPTQAGEDDLRAEDDDQGQTESDELMEFIIKTRDSGCCRKNCLRNLPTDEIFTCALSMDELRPDQRDMYLMGKVKITSDGENRQKATYTYYHQGAEVCKPAFMTIHNVKRTQLQGIITHIAETGPAVTPRTHGNTGKRPKHALTFEDTTKCVQFMLNYADVYGLPQPAAPRGRAEHPPVYLPVSTTQAALHKNYMESCTATDSRKLGLTSFVNIWKQCCPHIRIATPATDVCKTCEILRKEISDAVSETDKLDITSRLKDHVEHAQAERQLYRDTLAKAEEEWVASGLEMPAPAAPVSRPLSDVHYTFDFAQGVAVPHHARQMGPLYFLSPLKVQVFGVAMEGQHKQYNFLFHEGQSIGEDGKLSHGPNAVLSMLDCCFTKYGLGEQRCQLHCDNCGGENTAQMFT